jgi:4-amino-4-deoxy-L-arabinose transferase-like glycosyltransferase
LYKSALACAGIFVLALGVRLFWFVGYANVDPWDDSLYLRLALQALEADMKPVYSQAAKSLDSGNVPHALAFVVRRGTYLPFAASQWLFGRGEAAAALPSLAASLGTLVLIGLIGYRVAGRTVSLWGMLAFALLPLDLVYSTRILPAALSTFWITISIWLAIEANRNPRRRMRLLIYVLCGACLFAAYWTKLIGLLGLPLVGAACIPALMKRRTRYEPLLFLAIFLGALSLENLWWANQTGVHGFSFRVESAAHMGVFSTGPEAVFHPLPRLAVHSAYEEGVPHHFFKLFFGIVEHYDGLALFSAYAPLGIIALVFATARRRLGLLVFWVLFIFVFFQYGFRGIRWDGAENVLHYFLVAPRLRYLHLLLPPLSLLLGFLLAKATDRSRVLGVALFLSLALPSLVRSSQNYRFYRGSLDDMRAATRFLMHQDPAPIFTDAWGVELISILSNGALKASLMTPGELESGSLVVVGGSRGYELSSEMVSRLLPAPFSEAHLDTNRKPLNWKVLFTKTGPRHVSRRTDLVIYHVSPTQ